jgi:hypothetical protein
MITKHLSTEDIANLEFVLGKRVIFGYASWLHASPPWFGVPFLTLQVESADFKDLITLRNEWEGSTPAGADIRQLSVTRGIPEELQRFIQDKSLTLNFANSDGISRIVFGFDREPVTQIQVYELTEEEKKGSEEKLLIDYIIKFQCGATAFYCSAGDGIGGFLDVWLAMSPTLLESLTVCNPRVSIEIQ